MRFNLYHVMVVDKLRASSFLVDRKLSILIRLTHEDSSLPTCGKVCDSQLVHNPLFYRLSQINFKINYIHAIVLKQTYHSSEKQFAMLINEKD